MSRLAVVKKALSNKDVKQLIENFFSLAVLKVFNLILPFVTLPYLIKTLGFEQYGAIVLAMALMQYFQAVTDYGFNLSATRDIAKHRHSQQQLSYIYSKVMSAKVFLLAISLIILLPVIFLVPQFQQDKSIYCLMLLVLVGHTLFPEWFFRGVEKMRYITVLDLSIKLFFTAGVFLFIHKPEDYWVYPLLNGVGYLVVMFVAHRLVRKHFSVKFRIVKKQAIRTTLRNGFPLFVNQFMPNLFNNTTNFLVGMVLGKSAAGAFGATRQVVQLVTVLNSVTTTVFFPYLARKADRFAIYSKIYISYISAVVLIFILIHNFLLSFLRINYQAASNVFIALALGAWFISIYSVFSTNYLIVRGYYRAVAKMTVVSSIIGFLSSYPLILIFGVSGGAFNIMMTQGLMSVLAYLKYRKVRG
ncbi:oligosaccharide flippase family protein [Paenalcaligenes sp.]|uniref:oligosaccharide flippase family protein n=1 Tax=Paenalcaligenes sp. TaxID=1966342 RepID=UPI0026221807|nr:oligosaccharide flippase family protein [Paenalcaligenes sp.]